MANKLENIIQQKGDGVVPVIGGCKSMSPAIGTFVLDFVCERRAANPNKWTILIASSNDMQAA
ncbi:MAG TPA: hypothetical protein ENK04_12525 [Gammaproteobacteria bacterium]|nr:hypothetical protein [Gammaproteobacteria bacterium]